MRHPRSFDLPLSLDRDAPSPLGVQLADGLREAILGGLLRGGEALPSTRTLAARLAVSRGTVVAAFDQLHGEGWLVADTGATRVDPGVRPTALVPPGRPEVDVPQADPSGSKPPGVDLRPGQPDVSSVVDGAWRAAWREAVRHPGARHDPPGSPDLRHALADHVRTARGVGVDPQEMLVTAGVREGLQLVLTARALAPGAWHRLRVAVEDPGYPALRRVVAALGHEVVPVRVDGSGLRVDLLEAGTDVVLVTPGHQYPLGGAMPVARRLDLISWAREHGALVVEDDYDGELRFTGEPVPALAALDRPSPVGVVVTLGSFAKVLAPGIGLGHAIVPEPLRDSATRLRADLGCPVPATVQDALCHYLAAGALRRHVARMRRRYRARRDLAVAVLSGLDGVMLRPMDGGLHALVELGDAERERAVVAAAARAGVLVSGMAEYWADAGPSRAAEGLPRHGLVIGLGSPDIADGLTRLRSVLAAG